MALLRSLSSDSRERRICDPKLHPAGKAGDFLAAQFVGRRLPAAPRQKEPQLLQACQHMRKLRTPDFVWYLMYSKAERPNYPYVQQPHTRCALSRAVNLRSRSNARHLPWAANLAHFAVSD